MAGLDDVVPAAGEDSGLPPAAAPEKKKAAVPNQAGLNEWVSSPEFAANREKQIQDYYNQQLARIQKKQDSFGERWGIDDIRASYGAPTAEAQNQRMKLRQEELAGDRSREKEVFEGLGNLSQMKQAVQTRRSFNDYMEQKDYYANLAEKTPNKEQKAKYEQTALDFDKKARYLDPATYNAFADQDMSRNKMVNPGASYIGVDALGRPKMIAQGGIKDSDKIAAANTTHATGVNPLAGRNPEATLGGGVAPAIASPNQAGSSGGGGGSTAPISSQPGVRETAPQPVSGEARLAPLDNYRAPGNPIINQLPPAKREEMLIKKTPAFQKAEEQISGYSRMDKVISDILQNPEAMAIATGQTGFLTKFSNPKARNAALQLENLRELSSIEGLKKLRASGTAPGSITEAEWPKFESFFANLKNAQSAKEMETQLVAFRSKLAEEAVQSRTGYESDYGSDARFDKSFNKFRVNPEGRKSRVAADREKTKSTVTVKPEDDFLGLYK